ncbi:MAG: IS200/IS605 family transposase [Candidatus Cloacimonas sp.]|jgi:REP element-mobilizing transposase RayT|nr:IS200/IS605 family transposase [Candidatus Cloacimonas sp.]
MPASYCHIALHIVFSTRNRVTWLKEPLDEEMHRYMGGIISNLKGVPIQIGGIEDHVHILCLAPKEISLVEFMTKLKSNSSKWFRERSKLDFHWQDGYAAFSVSKSQIPAVIEYIKQQKEHHHHTSTIEEFELLLRKHLGDKA